MLIKAFILVGIMLPHSAQAQFNSIQSTPLSTSNQQTESVESVQDDRFFLTFESINGKKELRIFDRQAQRVFSITIPDCDDRTGEVTSVQFGHSDSEIAIACGSVITVWNYMTGEMLNRFEPNEKGIIQRMIYNPDGSAIAGVYDDRSVHIWNTATGDEVYTRAASPSDEKHPKVPAIAFSKNGERILLGFDETVYVIDIHSKLILFQLDGHSGTIDEITFSNFANEIITKSSDGSLRFWNATTGEELFSVPFVNKRNQYYSQN